MPRITRSNSTQETATETVPISPEKDSKEGIIASSKVTTAAIKSSSQSQCVIVAPDNLWRKQNGAFAIVKLRNPRTNVASLYAFSQDNTSIYEVNHFEESKRSWFLGDSVQSDGSLFLTSVVDPLFVILPYLYKAKHACPLDQLLVDEDFAETTRLCSCVNKDKVLMIADCKASGSFEAWKFNEIKVTEWLEKKVLKLANHLKGINFNVTQSAVAANYIKSSMTPVPETAFTRYAFGMVSEYLSEDLSILLEKHLNLPAVGKNLDTDVDLKEPPLKRQKLNDRTQEPTEDYSKEHKFQPAKEKIQVSAKEKKLASAAKGSRNISSFFGKK